MKRKYLLIATAALIVTAIGFHLSGQGPKDAKCPLKQAMIVAK